MTRVITYGTYDLFHYGHRALLEKAKALGDYLIVGVTADDFDKNRGKINVHDSLMQRIESVRSTGLADEIIIEEYEGQKIDDIKRYGIDIFTVGSDWVGKFDYLKEYCKVVYLPRTEGVSSTELRSLRTTVKMALIGDKDLSEKYKKEASFVNGLETFECNALEEIPKSCNAVYIASLARNRYDLIKNALNLGLNVLSESPLTLKRTETEEVLRLARSKNLILFDAIKTAYSTAYNRMLLLIKTGEIGKVISVDAVCTSLKDLSDGSLAGKQGSLSAWGSVALLPVLQILGTGYDDVKITSFFSEKDAEFDLFTKIDLGYSSAIGTIKVGKGVKSEGALVVSGTRGYVYVPAPWWKTDYFETRYEDSEKNRRFFYRLDGEGIRYMLVSFVNSIQNRNMNYVDNAVSLELSGIMEKLIKRDNINIIK